MKLVIGFLALYVSLAFAVKEELFKKCHQNGFCQRNRHYGQEIAAVKQAPYQINSTSLQSSKSDILLEIIKTISATKKITLDLQLSLINDNLRVLVNERRGDLVVGRLTPHRFNETGKWTLVDTVSPSTFTSIDTLLSDKLVLKYGKYHAAELTYFPLTLKVFYKNQLQITANDKNFFNFEHYRLEANNAANMLPIELDFDMFSDSFKDSNKDTIPFGPESIGLDFTFNGYQHVYGIPQHADSLSLRDTSKKEPYRLFNVDIFEYEVDSRMPMYGAIPFLLAVKPTKVATGLFWINSADTYVDIDKTSNKGVSTHWMSENGIVDFVIIVKESAGDVNKAYGELTGFTALPQLFALGYHQCRWNYNDQEDVLQVHENMDKYQIPYDTIWLDIEYTDAKKYFTWNKKTFPDPRKMLLELDRTGRNLVIIVDPHFKTDYFISNELIKQKLCLNDKDNVPLKAHCWPGESVWIDTFNPKATDFLVSKYQMSSKNTFMGGDQITNLHLWNDMNEPSVFDGPETTVYKDTVHFGNWEHRSVKNMYGMTFHNATFEALAKRLQNSSRNRPFILTRSFFAGSQRTAAMWTGDNMSKWEYLKASLPMNMNQGIAGMPFSGSDVGGFFGNPSKELLTRWYQTGIWYAFFRAHAHIDSRRREPWIAGEPYTSIIRDAVRLRYKLLPTIYTAMQQSTVNGTPFMKPLFYAYPGNLATYEVEDEFFVGDSGLLVKPVLDEGATEVDIFFPTTEEVFYDYSNGKVSLDKYYKKSHLTKSVTLNDIPVFIEGGSIISEKQRYRRSSKLMVNDPYTLIVAPSAKQGVASGKLYVDDYETLEYQQGQFTIVNFEANRKEISSTVSGELIVDNMVEKIVVLNFEGAGTLEAVVVKQTGETKPALFEIVQGNLVIKMPQTTLSKNWTVEFVTSADQAAHDEL